MNDNISASFIKDDTSNAEKINEYPVKALKRTPSPLNEKSLKPVKKNNISHAEVKKLLPINPHIHKPSSSIKVKTDKTEPENSEKLNSNVKSDINSNITIKQSSEIIRADQVNPPDSKPALMKLSSTLKNETKSINENVHVATAEMKLISENGKSNSHKISPNSTSNRCNNEQLSGKTFNLHNANTFNFQKGYLYGKDNVNLDLITGTPRVGAAILQFDNLHNSKFKTIKNITDSDFEYLSTNIENIIVENRKNKAKEALLKSLQNNNKLDQLVEFITNNGELYKKLNHMSEAGNMPDNADPNDTRPNNNVVELQKAENRTVNNRENDNQH